MDKFKNVNKSELDGLVHDLKTPITSIMGFVELLKQGGHDEKTTTEFYDIILSESQKLLKLVNDILYINKTGENKIDPCNLTIQLDKYVKELTPLAHKHKVKICINSVSSDIYVSIPEDKISRILINIIENAIKYNKEYGKIFIDIEEENKNFSFEDVVDKICKKIISKYPHVFREESSRNESSSRCRVYNLREREPKGLDLRRNRMNNHSAEEEVKRVSRILPALMRSAKVQERAAKAGYGLFSMEDALNETFERLHYLENLILDGRQDHYYKEIGDLLFSMTEISRLVGIDAESALYDSCERFKNEFLYKLSLEKGEKL